MAIEDSTVIRETRVDCSAMYFSEIEKDSTLLGAHNLYLIQELSGDLANSIRTPNQLFSIAAKSGLFSNMLELLLSAPSFGHY